jgi:hypothetical protein
LPRLNIIGEMVIDPARIAQVGNLDANHLKRMRIIRLALVAG